MSRATPFGMPGIDAKLSGEAYDLIWGPRELTVFTRGRVSSAAADAGNTPTTALRGGLLMARRTDTGEFVAYSATGANGVGSDRPSAILAQGLNTLDGSGTAVDKMALMIVSGLIKTDAVVGLDVQARAGLRSNGFFLFDDELQESAAAKSGGLGAARARLLFSVYQATNTMVVTPAMNGALIICDHSGAQTITLPTLFKGAVYEFYNTVDQNLTINGATGTISKVNSAAANSIAYSTSSQKIGAHCRVQANADATKWLCTTLSVGVTAT